MNTRHEGQRGGPITRVPSRRVAVAAARTIVAANKKRGVASSEAVLKLASEGVDDVAVREREAR